MLLIPESEGYFEASPFTEEFHFPGPTEIQPRGQTPMLSIILLWVKCLEESCQHRAAISMQIHAYRGKMQLVQA